jgi:hypothetical protein
MPIMKLQQLYTLPCTKNNVQEPFKGLVKLLRIRVCMLAFATTRDMAVLGFLLF